MKTIYAIQAEVLQTDNVAVCELSVVTEGDTVMFTADSKRYVDDMPDKETGREVALAKAFASAAVYFLGDHLENHG